MGDRINRVCNQKAMSYIKIKDPTAFLRLNLKINMVTIDFLLWICKTEK